MNVIEKVGPVRLLMLAGVTLAVLLFFVFVTTRLSGGEMSLLYSELSQQDRNQIVRELEENNITYIVDKEGNEIMVRANEVGRVRMLLAAEGLPGGASVGYELFDQEEGFSTTRFKQNLNKLRALEGELIRTISTLEPVENARVHLVMPDRSLFSREEQPATASVFLELQRSQKLSDEQVLSIQHLVAAAVPKLSPKRVSIVNQDGVLLASGREEDDVSFLTKNIQQMQLAQEMRLSRAVEDIVGSIVGYGKVRANVTVDMNFDRVATNSESYDPEGQVVRSTQVLEENDKEFEASTSPVTVENNLPGIPGQGASDLSRDATKVEEITNYEISKTITNHIREGGDVERMSVAVLVDGTYSKNEEGEVEYQPRSQEQIDKITALVKNSIGYDETRGDSLEVVNMRFANADMIFEEPEPMFDFMGLTKDDLFRASETAILALVAMLVILLVLRPMANRIMMVQDEDPDEAALLDEEGRPALGAPGVGTLEQQMMQSQEEEEDDLIDIKSIEGKVKASTINKVNEIIDNHPNEALSVIRSWLFEESG